MASARYSFSAEVWEHDGPAAWHFASLPQVVADEIEAVHGHRSSAFGSLRVDVTVGSTRWSTSLFPDRKLGTYVLPVKRAVRRAESLVAGAPVRFELVVQE